ncbi:MAG: protoheme IX farnesyltransferase [Alteromonadaceae bacterium]|nr:protoheme IX farnesyltransferase [Alteromonadaceae bacterium]RCL48186.1 MAG: protoheme IX farnesyltransferase [Halieaceae bacterium]RPH09425.1 MAG: protoheme IX farnesyltransferase [Alteromonadaceae bacterium TMED101]CAI8425748.1 MAG: Protoheme IX farnesyltransferase [Halieaceae bacterium]HCJ39130.1 protoheme IX farnesyltransferase [Halieaceae bacterium]
MSESVLARWPDFLELTKPRVVALMLLTALIGMCMAVPGLVPWEPLVFGNIGIGLCAGAAAAINHVVDERIDQNMSRTTNRPVAQGRVTQTEALVFAALLAIGGTALLAFTVNVLTAILTVASLVGYAFIYTMFLKRATPQNIVIGGLAGAAPPLLGWTAVTGEVHAHGLLLVLIIFAWTPPHFWALAIHRKDEYAAVGIPMLPVTHGNRFTALHILLYTILMFLITLLPFATLLSGWIYAVSAVVLGLVFLYWSIEILRAKNPKAPMDTFKYSINYLLLLFVAMLADHWILGSPV